MSKPLFHVHCTTCGARLKVTDRRAVGAILACPKCQCMVEVVPPPGFSPQDDSTESSTGASAPAAPRRADSPSRESDPSGSVRQEPQRRDSAADSLGSPAEPPAAEATASGGANLSAAVPTVPSASRDDVIRGVVEAPPVAKGTAAAAFADEDWESESAHSNPTWLSPAESRIRRTLLIAAGGLVAAGVLAGAWVYWAATTDSESPGSAEKTSVPQTPAETTETAASTADQTPLTAAPPSTPVTPGDVLALWMPHDAVFVMGGGEDFRRSYAQAAWMFSPLLPCDPGAIISDAMKSLGILPDAVDRVGLSVGPAGPGQAVIVFQLKENQSTASLESLGRPANIAIGNHKTITLQENAGTRLLILPDATTAVLGDAEYLRSASVGPDAAPGVSRGRWSHLGGEGSRWFVGIDLDHWRFRDFRFPSWALDRLPEAMPYWRRLLDFAVDFSIEMLIFEQGPRLACRWGYQDEGAADAGLESLNALIAAARQWVGQEDEILRAANQSGSLTAEQARPLRAMLSAFLFLLDRASAEKENNTVVLSIPIETESGDWINNAVAARPLLKSHWLQRGVALWRFRGETLGSGLQDVVKAEGLFPQAAAGGSLLPPETRLSWIASLLPYLGHQEWHAQLNSGYGWRAPQNRPVTSRELRAVINPLLGPTQTRESFFDTHWVGVAGVGENAAALHPDDPRAGFFNDNGRRRLEDLDRGAANTLAVLGASARLGAWAEGGFATARPLTRHPYVNGPDGFGSGLPQGMLGIMADGSVRFIHRDIAPELLERLAAVRGNGTATVADLFPAGSVPGMEIGVWSTPPSDNHSAPSASPEGNPAEGPGLLEKPSFPTEEALAIRLSRVTVQEVPLGLVLHLVTQWSSIPVSLQPEALCVEDVSLRLPVSLSVADITLQGMVRQIAEQTGLEVRTEPSGVVVLRSLAADLPDTRVYRSGDGAGCVPFDENLAQLIRAVFGSSPNNEAAVGFEVTLVAEGLQIKCLPCTHHEIETLLRRQLCRVEDPASGSPDDWPSQRPGDSLVSAYFLQPTPFSEVILALDQASEIDILVDWPNLVRAGITPQTLVTLNANDAPIGHVLRSLGGEFPLDTLEFDGAVILTTPDIANRPVIRVYPIAALIGAGASIARIRDQIVNACHTETWVDHGGSGLLIPFPAAKCLVARNSPIVCESVEKFLSSLAEKSE